jgi:hypothetical protein
MPEPIRCLRCQGDMEAGYIPDASYNTIILSSWVEGVPEIGRGWLASLRSGWLGKPLDGRQLASKSRLPIVSYRCSSCGMLENYAPSD